MTRTRDQSCQISHLRPRRLVRITHPQRLIRITHPQRLTRINLSIHHFLIQTSQRQYLTQPKRRQSCSQTWPRKPQSQTQTRTRRKGRRVKGGSLALRASYSPFVSFSCWKLLHGLEYPMHWQGVNSGATPEFSNFYLAVCRLHELIRERVWKTTFFPHSCISFRNRDLV